MDNIPTTWLPSHHVVGLTLLVAAVVLVKRVEELPSSVSQLVGGGNNLLGSLNLTGVKVAELPALGHKAGRIPVINGRGCCHFQEEEVVALGIEMVPLSGAVFVVKRPHISIVSYRDRWGASSNMDCPRARSWVQHTNHF